MSFEIDCKSAEVAINTYMQSEASMPGHLAKCYNDIGHI